MSMTNTMSAWYLWHGVVVSDVVGVVVGDVVVGDVVGDVDGVVVVVGVEVGVEVCVRDVCVVVRVVVSHRVLSAAMADARAGQASGSAGATLPSPRNMASVDASADSTARSGVEPLENAYRVTVASAYGPCLSAAEMRSAVSPCRSWPSDSTTMLSRPCRNPAPDPRPSSCRRAVSSATPTFLYVRMSCSRGNSSALRASTMLAAVRSSGWPRVVGSSVVVDVVVETTRPASRGAGAPRPGADPAEASKALLKSKSTCASVANSMAATRTRDGSTVSPSDSTTHAAKSVNFL